MNWPRIILDGVSMSLLFNAVAGLGFLLVPQAYSTMFPREIKQAAAPYVEKKDVEKRWCDKGNYKHIAQILTSIALYRVLQRHGKSEEDAFAIVSTEMWKALTPDTFQKLARHSWFMPVMKKFLPFGFRHGSGAGWKYDWHLDTDPKDRFHFECRECLYRHIFEEQDCMKLGAMFCHSDVINFGNLPYTDFRRTGTLCQGADCCDFDFIRHKTDAGDGWERTKSV